VLLNDEANKTPLHPLFTIMKLLFLFYLQVLGCIQYLMIFNF